jgi:hypothetical protein
MAYYQVIITGGPNKPVKAVAVSNVTVTAPPGPGFSSLDGASLTAGDPILLTNQTNKVENGVWIWNGFSAAMSRPAHAQDQYKIGNVLDNNTLIPVTHGTTFAGSVWGVDPAQRVIVDTDSHTLVQINLPPVRARVASTADVTWTNPGTTTMDGVTLAVGDVVLLKQQTSVTENGLYFWNGSSSSMTRTTEPLTPTRLVNVSQGTANAHRQYALTTQGPIVVGTTALNFSAQNLFNVRDFGAKGDGVTDDWVAIQAAIDGAYASGGGTVLFPPGIYFCLTQIVGKHNVHLLGEGDPATTITFSQAPDANIPIPSGCQVGGCIQFAGGFSPLFTGGGPPALSSDVSVNDTQLNFVATPSAAGIGDIVAIYEPANFSFNLARTYYRAGEFARVVDRSGYVLTVSARCSIRTRARQRWSTSSSP